MLTLNEFFAENPQCALGLSGGVDSTYLLAAGIRAGARIKPYFIKTQFQPEFELKDAESVCKLLGVELRVVQLDVLAVPHVAQNALDRCYHCKKALFTALRTHAMQDGFSVLIDGTNASDDVLDRPGMRATGELNVRSPLRECGITKAEVRQRAGALGLPTADKPAYACLATRVQTGEEITAEMLERIESAENILFARGYEDFRVRVRNGKALMQFNARQLERAFSEEEKLCELIGEIFSDVTIDTVGR